MLNALNAFHGKAETRIAALARLGNIFEAKRLTSGALFWNGTKASVAAALIESNDAQAWQDQLGLAKWMAYALDLASSNLPQDKAVEVAGRLLHGIPVGCDTSILGSRVIAAVLALAAPALASIGGAAQPLLAACKEISALHERVLAGDPPPASAWRAARKSATAATNTAESDHAKALGACVEAAAWDPSLAPTTVGDVLRLWSYAFADTTVDQRFGWTEDDDLRIRTLLQEMHETYLIGHPEEKRDVFMLLREHHPEVEARLLAYTKFQRTEAIRASEGTAQLLVDTVEAAP
jgi:hypothetical protein